MRYKTHMMGGIAAGLCLAAVTNSSVVGAIILSSTATIFARIPDFDHKDSRISHKHKLVGVVISTAFGQRNLFHSAVFYTAIFAASIFFVQLVTSINFTQKFLFIALAAYIGTLSHLLLDMPTPDGVKLLYPISKKHFHLPFVRIENGSLGEIIVFLICFFCCVPSILILRAAI